MRSSAALSEVLGEVNAGYSCGALSAVMGVGLLEIEDGNGSIEEVMLAGGEIAVEDELGMSNGAAAVATEGAGDPGVVEGTRSDVSCAKEGAGRIMERNRSGLERRCIRLLHLHGRHNRVGLIPAKRNEVIVWVKAKERVSREE